MKKIYFAPAMETVEINATCLLAGSLPLSSTPTIEDPEEVLAPQFPENVFYTFE